MNNLPSGVSTPCTGRLHSCPRTFLSSVAVISRLLSPVAVAPDRTESVPVLGGPKAVRQPRVRHQDAEETADEEEADAGDGEDDVACQDDPRDQEGDAGQQVDAGDGLQEHVPEVAAPRRHRLGRRQLSDPVGSSTSYSGMDASATVGLTSRKTVPRPSTLPSS